MYLSWASRRLLVELCPTCNGCLESASIILRGGRTTEAACFNHSTVLFRCQVFSSFRPATLCFENAQLCGLHFCCSTPRHLRADQSIHDCLPKSLGRNIHRIRYLLPRYIHPDLHCLVFFYLHAGSDLYEKGIYHWASSSTQESACVVEPGTAADVASIVSDHFMVPRAPLTRTAWGFGIDDDSFCRKYRFQCPSQILMSNIG